VDPVVAMSPLRKWLEQYRPVSDQIVTVCKEIGDIIWEGVCKINNGAPFQRSIDAPLKLSKFYKRKGSQKRYDNRGPLIRRADGPNFGILALILREALNKHHGYADGSEYLARILRGQHPLTSTRSKKYSDVDHYDPIRHNNTHLQLIRKHLRVGRLLTANGISVMGLWFLTGQGSQTKPFIESTDMFFTNVIQAEAAFKKAKVNGMKYDNTCVWGQPCSHLAVHAFDPITKRPSTIEEKFSPLFTEDMRNKWVAWLGGLVNFDRDPWGYKGFKHTWDEGLKFFEGLGLRGLGGGSLTAMQLTNTVAILGFIHGPSDVSMAHWIRRHPNKGAYRGLTSIGFDLDNRPKDIAGKYVLEALRAVYQHFDQSLCNADKVTFGFHRGLGYIFVEHVLCKLVRWAARFPKGKTQLVQLGQEAQEKYKDTWVQGENIEDNTGTKFPVSLVMDDKNIEAIEARLSQAWADYAKEATI
jgi:hypothetical protein